VVEPMKPIAAMMAINLRMCVVLVVLLGNPGVNDTDAPSDASLPFTAHHHVQNLNRLAN
jgi:hypothetical protein